MVNERRSLVVVAGVAFVIGLLGLFGYYLTVTWQGITASGPGPYRSHKVGL